MPSRHRPRRPGRRPTAALHPTRPRPARTAPRPQRSRRPTAPKAAGLPRQFRDTPTAANVLEQCALPGCTSPPVFKNKGARYCCPGHRLKHWRMKQRAAKDAATRTAAANDPPRPVGGVEREEQAGFDAAYQQALALARELAHLEELLVIDPRDEDARARLLLRRGEAVGGSLVRVRESGPLPSRPNP